MHSKRVRFESFAEAIDVSMALKLDRIWAGPERRWGLLLGLRASLNERRRPTSK
jgi:hypothetical protein